MMMRITVIITSTKALPPETAKYKHFSRPILKRFNESQETAQKYTVSLLLQVSTNRRTKRDPLTGLC